MAYAMYLNVGLHMPQGNVDRSLNKVLDLRLTRGTDHAVPKHESLIRARRPSAELLKVEPSGQGCTEGFTFAHEKALKIRHPDGIDFCRGG